MRRKKTNKNKVNCDCHGWDKEAAGARARAARDAGARAYPRADVCRPDATESGARARRPAKKACTARAHLPFFAAIPRHEEEKNKQKQGKL
jgi:hypothetical protein